MFENAYARHYDLFNRNKPYKEEIEFVYEWGGSPWSILDLGCGTAHYWKYFPRKARINGIENSKSMIDYSDHSRSILKANICAIDFSILFPYDLVTALFDVMNYLPDISWIEKLPIKKGKFFIFDILDKKKEKFQKTERELGNLKRIINPLKQDGKKVTLEISLEENSLIEKEIHELYLWSEKDMKKAAGDNFDIVEVKPTENWQTWYKLRKK